MTYNNNTKVTPNKVVGCHFLRQSLLLLVLFIPLLVLTACDDAGSDSDTGPTPAVQFTATVTNTTTTRTPNAAYQYVTFDIKSDVEVNVKLVLKEKGQPAPTRQEVLDGAGIYRALKTENKSLFLMYDINSKIKEYKEALEASGRGVNVVHDATATALTVNDTGNDTQNVDALLLKQNTTYTLYALQSDGPDTTEVQTLIDLTTREFDGTNSANLPASTSSYVPDFGISNNILYYDDRDAARLIPRAVNLQDILTIDISIQNSDGTGTAPLAAGSNPASTQNYCATIINNQNIISLLYPSFSSTGGTSCKASYNNVDYQYQYILMHDVTRPILNVFDAYTSTSSIPTGTYRFVFTKDQ